MHFLFLSMDATHQPELLGMAQLAAAFGQEVSVGFESVLPAPDAIRACRDAGVARLFATNGHHGLPADMERLDARQTALLLQQAERLVRL